MSNKPILFPDGGPGFLPIGSIFAWQGGYFTNGSNGGFTNVLGNTVANANTYLNPYGIYVCDGAALNDAASPIFNAAGRYLPNLTDSRFLMGSTTAGTTGGENTNSHTHSVTSSVSVSTQPTFSMPKHYHGMGTGADLNITASGGHTHSYTVNTTTSTTNGPTNAITTITGTAGATSGSSTHTHAKTDFSGSIGIVTGGVDGNVDQNCTRTANVALSNGAVTSGTPSDTENRPLYLSTFYVMRVK